MKESQYPVSERRFFPFLSFSFRHFNRPRSSWLFIADFSLPCQQGVGIPYRRQWDNGTKKASMTTVANIILPVFEGARKSG